MKKDSLLDIYDESYAESYNDKFLTNPFSKVSVDFELNVLSELVKDDTTWLDVGCGTGYFLSRFPSHKRAGMDISPEMLTVARKANPDAMFFKEGDFRLDVPEWHGQWSLVSCMWYPYSYVESLPEVEQVIQNMVKWTQPGGTVFLPIADLDDLRHATPHVPYKKHEEVYGGMISITGYTWTWVEGEDQKTHVNMVAPHLDHVIQLMEPFFETIEVVRYPPAYEGWVSRRAILARNKNQPDENQNHKANIIRHAVPAPANISQQTSEHAVEHEVGLTAASHKQLLSELLKRLKDGRLAKSLLKKLFLL
jgi:SAM-dependent methyltransferase